MDDIGEDCRQLLIDSSLLPKEFPEGWVFLEGWGFKNLGDANESLYNVELPTGWQLKASKHPSYIDLYDPEGLRRASVFYEEAGGARSYVDVFEDRYLVCRDFGSNDYDKNRVRYCIEDLGLERKIKFFSSARYAFLSSDPKIFGAIFEERFYYEAIRTTPSETCFTKVAGATDATVLSGDEFHAKCGGKKDYCIVLLAMKNLAKAPAKAFWAELPRGW